ncbi:acyl-CoA N-acyltransferase [Xylogone sp. PMI_703]|nr:acyl-CoA N-acyltransferase [Xylogone sp. PMI_703]
MHATAAEQGAANAVKATEAGLLNTLEFDDPKADSSDAQSHGVRNGKVFVIVAPEGKIAGMAIYFITYVAWLAKSGLLLEDLYVLPEYRKRGYARLLVQAVVKKGESLGCARVEWLCYKQNDRALRFYRSLGAKEMDSMTFLRLEGDAMAELASDVVE